MSLVSRLAARVLGRLVGSRERMPRFVVRLMDDVAANPDGRAARLAARLLGGHGGRVPPPTVAPSTPIRVYIGPTNYAGQGYLWARALESSIDGVGARNMAIELPGGFSFAADSLVPVDVHTASRAWQEAELAAVLDYTHVLFEAERPLFGPVFDRDVQREIDALDAAGISSAFMCHGTDIRSPRRHLSEDRFSPYADDPATPRLQAVADANHALLETAGLPVFVSTPDLLLDVPSATWCPVVVDVHSWSGARPLFADRLPVVVHLPSMGPVKGTHLIEPTLRRMHDAGLIEYRGRSGIPSNEMPAVIGDADIVLDQFRIGSYGVAAVEAMASGRVVVGHVLPAVRALVAELTGHELRSWRPTPTPSSRSFSASSLIEERWRRRGQMEQPSPQLCTPAPGARAPSPTPG